MKHHNFRTTPYAARPKEPRLENAHLRLMHRMPNLGCLLQIPGLCDGGRHGTCLCHGNSGTFNKGFGLKAHDFFGVRGCGRCHNWLDESYTASGEERQAAFLVGLGRQIEDYISRALDPSTTQKDYDAIQWALQHLIERGYAKKRETTA